MQVSGQDLNNLINKPLTNCSACGKVLYKKIHGFMIRDGRHYCHKCGKELNKKILYKPENKVYNKSYIMVRKLKNRLTYLWYQKLEWKTIIVYLILLSSIIITCYSLIKISKNLLAR